MTITYLSFLYQCTYGLKLFYENDMYQPLNVLPKSKLKVPEQYSQRAQSQ